jgi:sorbitol-specific phosphotransferase system component IIBC
MKIVSAEEGKIINKAIGKYGEQSGVETINSLMVNILNTMLLVGAVMLIITIIWSGIGWMIAGGDKEKLQKAQKRLTHAIIGFIILICVFAIANFVGGVFGLGFFKDLKFILPTPEG